MKIAAISLQQSFWNGWNASHREHDLQDVSIRQAEVVCGWLKSLGRSDLKILEVGCGSGWFGPRLAKFGETTGTDLSDEVLARAGKAPAGQARSDSELPPGPPASRSPLVATVPFEVVLPKAGSLPQATQNPEQPADGQTATVAPADPAADNAAPAQPTGRFPRGSLGCTRFKTYDAQTQTYRGRGGVVRPCRPL